MVLRPEATATGRGPLPGWAIAADVVTAALLLLGAGILIVGPIPRIDLAGLRVSVSSPQRAILIAAVIAAVRHWLVPRHPILTPILTPIVRRVYVGPDGPDSDERHLFGRPGSTAWPAWLELAVVVAAFCTLVATATWPQIRRLDSVPDLGDPLFSVWRIAWIAHQVVHDPMHLFDGNMFYPERLTLTYSDPVLVPALFAAPLFWIGVHALTVYNLLFLSGFAFSGVTMFLLVRALTGRRDAAAVAGVIFALYPYRFEHYSHLELQMTMWAPLVLWGVHRTMALGRLRDGLATGVAFALQTLSSLYYGLFLTVYLIPIGATLWVARRRPWPAVRALSAGAVLAAVIIAPTAVQFVRNKPMLGERAPGVVQFYSATAADYSEAHPRSRWYEAWSHNGHPERALFPGFASVVLALVALWPPVKAARLGYALALAVAFDGSLGLNGTLYRNLYDDMPPFRGLRVPARFSIFAGMTLAILAGYGAARILERWPRKRVALAGTLLAVVVLEPWPRLQLETVWHQPPPIYGSLPTAPPAVLAEFPMPTDWTNYYIDARYLYFSTFHWQRLVNGNSGFSPPSYDALIAHEKDFPSEAAVKYLQARHVEYVAVHGAFYSPQDFRRMVGEIGARPELTLVRAAPWEGSESRLYRLR